MKSEWVFNKNWDTEPSKRKGKKVNTPYAHTSKHNVSYKEQKHSYSTQQIDRR